LSKIIEQGKNAVVSYANAALTLTFWQVGKRINEVVLKNKRADYGQKIVATMSEELSEKYGRGFEEKNLRRMLQFAQEFPTEQIVVPLARQLSWSHFTILLPIKNNDAKLFYANQSIAEKWSKRDLRQAISRKTFERAKIADTQLTANALIPQNTFKDPYLFDFLGLKNDYLENYLETAILREIESFILEFGKGFAFVERQKRMIIDGEDFYLDLLLYNRTLKRLVAVELKLGKFQAKYKGQMELYLKWLNKYERKEGESVPIGLILCAETSREQIELLEMHKDGIWWRNTGRNCPPKKNLSAKSIHC
jgi:predicted nuclease of restriction endonuclease-like (RecB) superfamily